MQEQGGPLWKPHQRHDEPRQTQPPMPPRAQPAPLSTGGAAVPSAAAPSATTPAALAQEVAALRLLHAAAAGRLARVAGVVRGLSSQQPLSGAPFSQNLSASIRSLDASVTGLREELDAWLAAVAACEADVAAAAARPSAAGAAAVVQRCSDAAGTLRAGSQSWDARMRAQMASAQALLNEAQAAARGSGTRS